MAVKLPKEYCNMADDHCCACSPYWYQRLYKGADQSDHDARFWHDALKSNYMEGKMGAREQAFAKGGGYPSHVPVAPQQPGGGT